MNNHTTLILILSIGIALACAASAAESPKKPSAMREAFSRSKHGDALRGYWENYYKSTDNGKKLRSGIPYYPTEPGVVFLSAWLCTGTDKYRQAAILQFDFAHARENSDGLLITELGFNRDTEARQIYNFYVAYKLLGDKKYLTWADASARGLIDHLPRRKHQVFGTTKSYLLFAAGYCRDVKPYDTAALNPWVDVNQNAELALAYTLLYHEPKSVFYKSPLAKDIVVNEMEAGLAIQDSKTGAIPIGDSDYWITRCDTLYGAYGLFSWTWLNTQWKNAEWQKHIVSAGRWLAGFSTGQGKPADRFYPNETDALSSTDVWYRIPGLWKAQFAPDRLIDQWFTIGPSRNSGDEMAHAPFAYFQMMRIPPEFYLSPIN